MQKMDMNSGHCCYKGNLSRLLAGGFWELKTPQLKTAEVEKHWSKQSSQCIRI